MANKKCVANIIEQIAQPIADEMGFDIWDIRFEKEGPNWFLKIFIDKEQGVNINDCENFSRRIDKLIDDADPIEQSYILEISSPGIERKLVKNHHIRKYLGHMVDINFIRPFNGYKNLTAKLIDFDDSIITVLLNDNSELKFNKDLTAYIKLSFDMNQK